MRTKKVFISFADKKYLRAQRLCSWTAKRIAKFDEVIEFHPQDIDEEFKEKNSKIFSVRRGLGLWLWKPYLILKVLNKLNEGDVLVYCDSATCFIKYPKQIFEILKTNWIWVTELPLVEKQFTKKLVFEELNMNSIKYLESRQISGTFIALQKCEESKLFVSDWLKLCSRYELISPPISKKGEDSDFYEHREDQSLLSLLVKKNEIMTFSDPSQYGRLPEKYHQGEFLMSYRKQIDYAPFIIHHRSGEVKYSVLIRQLACALLPRKVGLMFIKNNK